MADGYLLATMAGLRAALVADPAVAALVGDRIVDAPEDEIPLPYVRFASVSPRADDTDGTQGAIVQVGLAVHSRPLTGREEAARICAALHDALHRSETVTATGYTVSDIEVQTWSVDRASDGATYEGRVALEVHLDA